MSDRHARDHHEHKAVLRCGVGAGGTIECREPVAVLAGGLAESRVRLMDRWLHVPMDGVSTLDRLLAICRRDPDPGRPFGSGAIGYVAYEAGRLFERLPDTTVDDLGLPPVWFAFYDRARWRPSPDADPVMTWDPRPIASLMATALDEMGARPAEPWPAPKAHEAAAPLANIGRPAFEEKVARAVEYVRAGDIFQVNLSRRLTVPCLEEPLRVFDRLVERAPAPFCAFIDCGDFAIASDSPERFLMRRGDRIETRPIKGTRARGPSLDDQAQARDLLASAKDRAEHVMIVDLERNDLGRICTTGSVEVPRLAGLEGFPTVWHLVSVVQGTLGGSRTPPGGPSLADILAATFPGGSISGAPKVRALEIIDELEPTARSVYTGALGYIDFSGDFDLAIAIRTLILVNGTAHFQVGGGIVADSVPEAEYEETVHKARAFLELFDVHAEALA